MGSCTGDLQSGTSQLLLPPGETGAAPSTFCRLDMLRTSIELSGALIGLDVCRTNMAAGYRTSSA